MNKTDVSALPPIPAPTQENWVATKKTFHTQDGTKLAYLEWGDPNAPAALLIHGYTDSSRAWSLVANHLKNRRFIAVDLRGHGDSQKVSRGFDVLTLSHDLADLLEALDVQNAEIIGHSMGSIVAASFAAFYPEKTRHLVLISSALENAGELSAHLWDTLLQQTFPIDPDSAFMDEWTWNPHPVDQTFLSYVRKEEASTPKETWFGCLWAFETTNWTNASARIQAPILILWGDQDPLMQEPAQEALKATLPTAKHTTFEGYGHSMIWEDPEGSAREIQAFIDTPL